MNRLAIALPLAAILCAACARSEDASVLANVQGADRPPPQPTALDDGEPAIGEWRESLQDDFAALDFGPLGAPPLFSLRCGERDGLLLQRHGMIATGDLPVMLVTIGSETRRLPVASAGGTIPMLRAALAPRDPLLVNLRASAPITIRIGDTPPLVLPPSPLVAALIESCLSGTGRPYRAADETNASAGANQAEPIANAAR